MTPIFPLNHRDRLIRAMVTTLSLVSLAAAQGCVGKPAAEWATQPDAQCPITQSQQSGSMRIGYLGSPGPDLYVYGARLAEACFPNADVQWVRYPTGQDMVQAFASGSLDLGAMGSTPTAKAISGPLSVPLVVPGVSYQIGDAEALVAKKATTLEGLRGSKIAVPFSSTSHYSLLKALTNAGLDPQQDVHIVNVSPDKIPAAWKSDDIDAAFVWSPALSEIAPGNHVLCTAKNVAEQGSPTFNITAADKQWAADHGELLSGWMALQRWAEKQSQRNHSDYINVNSSAAQMQPDQVNADIAGQVYLPVNNSDISRDQLATALHDTAQFLKQQGEVETVYEPAYYQQLVVNQREEGNREG